MTETGTTSSLSFKGIQQSFPGPNGEAPTPVINDIGIEVHQGKFVSVIGPSGCGKSTLLQMAAGLLKPTGGKVFHNGHHVIAFNRTIGFVPQQAQLLPWKTIIENLEFPSLLRCRSAPAGRAQAP